MLRKPMPEVRLYGEWKSAIVLRFGRRRDSYSVILTSVPNGEVGMAYVMRLRRGQAVESVAATAKTLTTPVLKVDVRAHDEKHVRVVLRGEEVADWVQKVWYLQTQGKAITGALALPLLHGLAQAVTETALEKGVKDAVRAYRPLIRRVMA